MTDSTTKAGSPQGLSPTETPETPTDTERLDWIEQRVHGTGETLSMGGSCYWGIEVQRGQYGKLRRLGEGDDLRDAIDAAMEANPNAD